MLVSGELENVPLLDVLQVVSYSKQTGVLSVESASTEGTILFERGGIVCAASTSTRPLFARAARESDVRARFSLSRIAVLAALTELLALRKGGFRFKNTREPVAELAGVSTRSFYGAGPMDTGELLLVLATSIDKPAAPAPGPRPDPPRDRERAHARVAPTLIPASIELSGSSLDGHLTNLSEGGAFFQGDVLPPNETSCRIRFVLPGPLGPVEASARIAWTRPEGRPGEKGAGLAFLEVEDEARARLARYLKGYQALAAEVEASD